PVGVLVDRLRSHVIREGFVNEREGPFLFHGAASEAGFNLIPVAVALFRSVSPWPVHITGEFEPAEVATTVRATLRLDAIVYWAGGLCVLALLGLLAYAIAVAPELAVAWLLVFLPAVLLTVGGFWLYSWNWLRSSKRLLQNALRGEKS